VDRCWRCKTEFDCAIIVRAYASVPRHNKAQARLRFLEHVYRIAKWDRQIAIFFLPMAMRMSIREFQTSLDSCYKWKSGSRTTTLVVKLQQIA